MNKGNTEETEMRAAYEERISIQDSSTWKAFRAGVKFKEEQIKTNK